MRASQQRVRQGTPFDPLRFALLPDGQACDRYRKVQRIFRQQRGETSAPWRAPVSSWAASQLQQSGLAAETRKLRNFAR